jgi:hypothetical protein
MLKCHSTSCTSKLYQQSGHHIYAYFMPDRYKSTYIYRDLMHTSNAVFFKLYLLVWCHGTQPVGAKELS